MCLRKLNHSKITGKVSTPLSPDLFDSLKGVIIYRLDSKVTKKNLEFLGSETQCMCHSILFVYVESINNIGNKPT